MEKLITARDTELPIVGNNVFSTPLEATII